MVDERLNRRKLSKSPETGHSGNTIWTLYDSGEYYSALIVVGRTLVRPTLMFRWRLWRPPAVVVGSALAAARSDTRCQLLVADVNFTDSQPVWELAGHLLL
jgi:hypothetical protein